MSFASGLRAALVFAAFGVGVGLPQAVSAADSDPAFRVTEFRVLGNTVLRPADIERALYPFLGEQRTLADVEAARDVLATVYRDAGYGAAVVDVPEQTVDRGIVRLRVTEGRVDRVRISGARFFSQRRVRDGLGSLAPGAVLHLPSLQAELNALAGQSRDRRITPVLRSGSEPGTVAIDLRVEDSLPLHVSIEANDRYTADTSRARVGASLSYENMFQRFDTLSFQYQTAPAEPSETSLLALTYIGRTGDPSAQWAAYAVRSDSDVAAIGTLSVLGRGSIYGLRYIRALDGGGRFFPGLTLGVDFKDFRESILLADSDPASTPISYWLWSAQFSLATRGEGWAANGALSLNLGHRGLGNSSEEFAFKRYFGRPNLAYLRGNLGFSRDLPRAFALAARASYQFTPRPLISNEQFGYGGVDTVRGYLEAEALADLGAAAGLELRLPEFRPAGVPVRGHLFADAAVGSILRALPAQQRRVDLSSWGAGLRVGPAAGFEAAVDWAYPLVPGPRTAEGDDRWHLAVTYGF